MSTEYEIQRQKNIAANLAILASLGLEKPAVGVVRQKQKTSGEKKKKKAFKKVEKVKRQVSEISDGDKENVDADADADIDGGRRKSKRISAAARKVMLDGDSSDGGNTKSRTKRKRGRGNRSGSISDDSNTSDSDEEYRSGRHRSDSYDDHLSGPKGVYNDGDKPGLPRRLVNGRYVAHLDPHHTRPNPKTFGAIPNVPVGTWWSMRQEASAAGVHAPFVAGIFGTPTEGCYSVALSGGYEDDVDEGFRFTYTGSGGRELKKKNLRTAPQSRDQTLEKGNAALVRSFETGRPVRVIRGFKGNNMWAPKSGYRYDGLYQVVKWWKEKGLAGFLVFKYAFKRVDGQEPIDLTAGPPDSDEEDEGEDDDDDNENDGNDDDANTSESLETKASKDMDSAIQKQLRGEEDERAAAEEAEEEEAEEKQEPKPSPPVKRKGRKGAVAEKVVVEVVVEKKKEVEQVDVMEEGDEEEEKPAAKKRKTAARGRGRGRK